MHASMDVVHSGASQTTIVNEINIHWHSNSFYLKHPDDNTITASQVGAIEVIVGAMRTHIEDSDVCKHGCGALGNITCDNGKMKLIIYTPWLSLIKNNRCQHN